MKFCQTNFLAISGNSKHFLAVFWTQKFTIVLPHIFVLSNVKVNYGSLKSLLLNSINSIQQNFSTNTFGVGWNFNQQLKIHWDCWFRLLVKIALPAYPYELVQKCNLKIEWKLFNFNPSSSVEQEGHERLNLYEYTFYLSVQRFASNLINMSFSHVFLLKLNKVKI